MGTRSHGRRENLNSRLLVLPPEEIGFVETLRAKIEKRGGTPTRCGPEGFGCEIITFNFKLASVPEFKKICERLISENNPDGRSRRITSCVLSTYSATKTCSTRDNRVMLAVHRDDGQGDDMSLVFGLSPPQQYSGGLLRVAVTESGNMQRRERRSDKLIHKCGSVAYDVSSGRCCVLLNVEHSVQRLHWGKRSVAVVTAKPVRTQE